MPRTVGGDEPILLIVGESLGIQVEIVVANGGGEGLNFVNIANVIVEIFEVGQGIGRVPPC